MATWRVENSMLTKRGIEILNKIKAGIGSITITKIVAGSGRVEESELFNQTTISGTTKLLTISQVDTRDSGSEISTYIENSKFTESFDLHQIGVYVTHDDYEGEQLYHISQCDYIGFDQIPALDETPITFGYSLLLEHGNSSSINITVDPQSMVLAKDFMDFKSHIESKVSNLNYSDVNAVPLGYVEDTFTDIESEVDLDSTLEDIYTSMDDHSSKKVVVTFKNPHPILGGSDRIITIDKMTNSTGVIHSVSCDPNGVSLEYFRGRKDSQWTSWSKSYSTSNKPSPFEIGASPLISRGTFSGDISIIDNDQNIHDNSVVLVSPEYHTSGLPHACEGFLETITAVSGFASFQKITFTDGSKCQRVYYKPEGGWGEWEWENIPKIFLPNQSAIEYKTTKRLFGKPLYAKCIKDEFSDETGATKAHSFFNTAHLHISEAFVTRNRLVMKDYVLDPNLSITHQSSGSTPGIVFYYKLEAPTDVVELYTVFMYTKSV